MSLRIGYIARHDQANSADDEGAITHALQALGHRVERLRERRIHVARRMECDFTLLHHCHDYEAIGRIPGPKVAWTFDLFDYPDPLLRPRNRERLRWLRELTRVVDLVFATDGDAVAADRTGKMVWLPQGADERVTGPGTPGSEVVPLLFTGMLRGGGTQRIEFVHEMTARYGAMFRHVEHGVYGRALADLIAAAQIVLAPSGPVTDRYWSNRVFNVLGYGGFLLHPYSEGLAARYTGGEEIVYYHDMDDLHAKIRHYMERPEERRRIAAAGLARTLAENLYRHRCAELVRVVQERLL